MPYFLTGPGFLTPANPASIWLRYPPESTSNACMPAGAGNPLGAQYNRVHDRGDPREY